MDGVGPRKTWVRKGSHRSPRVPLGNLRILRDSAAAGLVKHGCGLSTFLSEAVSQGMTSIVANASLIKKVYVPKYIYPFSKTVSSLINFAIALLPLAIVENCMHLILSS